MMDILRDVKIVRKYENEILSNKLDKYARIVAIFIIILSFLTKGYNQDITLFILCVGYYGLLLFETVIYTLQVKNSNGLILVRYINVPFKSYLYNMIIKDIELVCIVFLNIICLNLLGPEGISIVGMLYISVFIFRGAMIVQFFNSFLFSDADYKKTLDKSKWQNNRREKKQTKAYKINRNIGLLSSLNVLPLLLFSFLIMKDRQNVMQISFISSTVIYFLILYFITEVVIVKNYKHIEPIY